jgi:CBS domain containing-hemolysin-like protein
MTTVIIIVICALLVEGFFSGSEIAVVSADRADLRQKANEGDNGARLALSMLAESRSLLATTLVGTNLAVVTSTVVVTLYFLETHPAYAELYALAIMSPLLLLMGEVIPKSLFQQHADYLARKVVYPLFVCRWLFSPVLFLLSCFTRMVTNLLGVEGDRPFVTREELQRIIESVEKQRGGEITAGEAEMISNVLDVEDRVAEQVMLPLSEVCSVDVGSSVYDLIQLIREKRHTRIPVHDQRVDNIVGIVQAFDLINVDPARQSIRSLMHRPMFIPETQPVLDLVQQLNREDQRMAVVVNEYGGAEGVVTIEDALEEIVGEIEDEYDVDVYRLKREGPGRYLAEGRVQVERINRELGLDLPEGEDYETVAGLVLDQLKRMPRPRDRVIVGPVTIEVVKASERAVELVRLLVR